MIGVFTSKIIFHPGNLRIARRQIAAASLVLWCRVMAAIVGELIANSVAQIRVVDARVDFTMLEKYTVHVQHQQIDHSLEE